MYDGFLLFAFFIGALVLVIKVGRTALDEPMFALTIIAVVACLIKLNEWLGVF